MQETQLDIPLNPEFERMYTIRIDAPPGDILDELENYGEADRHYLKPRGIRILRVSGQPHQPGCLICYDVLFSMFRFHLRFEKIMGERLAVYRVVDGFAAGGLLLFEIEQTSCGDSLLSIYVVFNFPADPGWRSRLWWSLFRRLFPAYAHDVLWNHALCKLKDVIEKAHATSAKRPQPVFAWQI